MPHATIHSSSREVIENKLLMALEDPGTVAVLTNQADLKLLIESLTLYSLTPHRNIPEQVQRVRARDFASDLQKLYAAAFPNRQ
jgi:hypothetical protein